MSIFMGKLCYNIWHKFIYQYVTFSPFVWTVSSERQCRSSCSWGNTPSYTFVLFQIYIFSFKGVILFSVSKQQHYNNVKLDTQPLVDEVIRDSKKRKREANLATWKWNDVIEIESSDDESIFDGDDDTFDDVLSMSNIKRKKRTKFRLWIMFSQCPILSAFSFFTILSSIICIKHRNKPCLLFKDKKKSNSHFF